MYKATKESINRYASGDYQFEFSYTCDGMPSEGLLEDLYEIGHYVTRLIKEIETAASGKALPTETVQ